MPVIFKCDCGQYLVIQSKYMHQKFKCPSCQAIKIVPSPSDPEIEGEIISKIDDTSSNNLAIEIPENKIKSKNRCQFCGAKIPNDQLFCSLCKSKKVNKNKIFD